jgi:predicted N-acetyltransferase YhbS
MGAIAVLRLTDPIIQWRLRACGSANFMESVLSRAMSHYPEIRQATESDAANITTVINRAFGEAEHFFVDGDRITAEEVQDSLRTGAFLVAEHQGEMVGCVYVEPRGERAYLGLLSVDPDHQHRGVGVRLMRSSENFCIAAACRFMDIKIVNLRTDLPSYYRKFGYIETGSSAFPADVETKIPCHFIDMSKPL